MSTPSRDRLLEALDGYFAALAANDPGLLSVAPGARFTENGQELALGRGLWRTATGVAPSRAVAVADVAERQVAGWGLVEEAGDQQLLALRLRVAGNGALAEIESLVVRPADLGRAGHGFPDALLEPSAGFLEPIPVEARAPRATLAAVADGYLEGVARNDADRIEVADDCVRVENGRQTVLTTSAEGFPGAPELYDGLSLSVAEQVRRGDFHYIEAIRDRTVAAVDEERGLVLLRCFFDHPGRVRHSEHRSPFATPNSMLIFECFKVVGGTIRHVEAVGTKLAYACRPGW